MTVILPYKKFDAQADDTEFARAKMLPPWIDKLAERINTSKMFMMHEKVDAEFRLGDAKEHIEEGIDTKDFDLVNEGLDIIYDVGDELRIWIG